MHLHLLVVPNLNRAAVIICLFSQMHTFALSKEKKNTNVPLRILHAHLKTQQKNALNNPVFYFSDPALNAYA